MGRDFPFVQTGPAAHSASCTIGTGSFPGVKNGRGVLLNTHPLLVPRSWNSRAIPLPTLLATTGPVTGTLYLYSIGEMVITVRPEKPRNYGMIPNKVKQFLHAFTKLGNATISSVMCVLLHGTTRYQMDEFL